MNVEQAASWNGDSGRRWAEDADRRDAVLAPIGEVLLSASGIKAGERVLDIGCGCGASTIAAARMVGPWGTAVGIDLSDPMLEVARMRARDGGVSNSQFERADAQTWSVPDDRFDVAISRFGTMFFDDPVQAFSRIAVSLRPSGRMVLATWQPLVANDWLTIPGATLLRYGSLPESSDGSGMFAQSDPVALTDVLNRAGFGQVDSQPMRVKLLLGSDAAEATAYLTETGPGSAVLETVAAKDVPAAIADVRSTLAAYEGARGVELEAGILLTSAVRRR